MTKEEQERIFGKSHPVDVDAFGEYLNNCKLDINKYADGKAKGLMLKCASSPSFQRLHNAIQKLAAYYNSGYRSTEQAAEAVDEEGKPGDTTKNTLANLPPLAMLHDGVKMQTQETVKLAGGKPIVKNV